MTVGIAWHKTDDGGNQNTVKVSLYLNRAAAKYLLLIYRYVAPAYQICCIECGNGHAHFPGQVLLQFKT